MSDIEIPTEPTAVFVVTINGVLSERRVRMSEHPMEKHWPVHSDGLASMVPFMRDAAKNADGLFVYREMDMDLT